MTKIQRIHDSNTIKPNDIIIFKSDSGSVFSIDRVISIDHENKTYDYINLEGKRYQGNLTKCFRDFTSYKVINSNEFNYSNKDLDNAFLHLDGLFDNLFDNNLMTKLIYFKLNTSRSDIELRIKLIDFVRNNANEIHDIVWMNDEELRKCDSRIEKCKAKLISELEKVLE